MESADIVIAVVNAILGVQQRKRLVPRRQRGGNVDDEFLSKGENREDDAIRDTHNDVIRLELIWPALEALGAQSLIVDESVPFEFLIYLIVQSSCNHV